MKKLRPFLIMLWVLSALISSCAVAPSSPSPTPKIKPRQISSHTLAPTAATLTPFSPSPTSTLTPIILTDGVHHWLITSVIVSGISTYISPSDFALGEGFNYLTIEFESQGTDIASMITGINVSGAIAGIFVPTGIYEVYVVDIEKKVDYAIEVTNNHFVIPVRIDSSGYVLYVLDWEPVVLGK